MTNPTSKYDKQKRSLSSQTLPISVTWQGSLESWKNCIGRPPLASSPALSHSHKYDLWFYILFKYFKNRLSHCTYM